MIWSRWLFSSAVEILQILRGSDEIFSLIVGAEGVYDMRGKYGRRQQTNRALRYRLALFWLVNHQH